MEANKIDIKHIAAEDTYDIRHSVMWPDKEREFVILKEDNKGEHFGLFVNSQLVSIISLFYKGTEAQFRKFATIQSMQAKGYGSKLLKFTFDYLIKKGFKSVWANSRVEKAYFYEKFGMRKTCKTYQKGGIDFVIVEREF